MGDPATAAVASQGIKTGGALAGGAADQFIFQPQKNRASGRQAAQVDEFVKLLEDFSAQELRDFDTSPLKDFRADDLRGLSETIMERGGATAPTVDTGALTGFSADSLRASDTSGLRAATERQLGQQGERLNAQLASRGIFNTGTGARAQGQLMSETLGNLAQQINADQRAREQAALGLEQQSLSQGLGMDVQQRGQTISGQNQAFGTAASALGQATGLEQRSLSQALGMDLDAITQALGLELGALENAGALVQSTPGYKYFDRESGQVGRGK